MIQASPQFEVSSVRPISVRLAREQQLRLGLHCRGIDGELFAQQNVQQPGTAPMGRCTGTVAALDLILSAYSSPAYDGFVPTIGLPNEFDVSGPDSTLYQIQAIAPNPSRVTKAELQQMLRSLLEDRFKLKARYETREIDGLHLTVAGSGIKFKETSLGEQPCSRFRPGTAEYWSRQLLAELLRS
jgi:uncharacterized protein (TIGR03435 family)